MELSDQEADALGEQLDAWSKRCAKWLQKNFPDYLPHFLNPTGKPLLEVLFGTTRSGDRMRTFLDTRMARLSEVMMKL